jgi:hypothetical protein
VDLTRQIGATKTREEFVQGLDIPPAIHVGFAHADAAFSQGAIEEPLVVDLDVPRFTPIHAYTCKSQELYDFPSSSRIAPDMLLCGISRLGLLPSFKSTSLPHGSYPTSFL